MAFGGTLRLGTKLYLSFGIVLALGTMVALLLILNTSSLAHSYERLGRDAEIADLFLDFKANRLLLSDSLRGWMLHPYGDFGRQELERKRLAEERLAVIAGQLEPLTSADPELSQGLARVEAVGRERLYPLEQEFLSYVEQQESAAAEELYFERYLPARYELERLIEELVELSHRRRQAAIEASRRSTERAIVLGLTLTAALVGAGAGLSLYLSRRTFGQPIGRLTASARAISGGDFTRPLTLDRGDELGVMAAAFNQMVERLRDSNASLGQQLARVREASQQLRQMQAQLVQQEKMASLGQLVAGVAHELNNPIGFIYSNTIYLEESLEKLRRLLALYDEAPCLAPAPVAQLKAEIGYEGMLGELIETVRDCHDGAGRVRDIVRNLRTFSRLDEAELQAVSIPEALDATLRLLHQYFRPDRVAVRREYGPIEPVSCYAGQLNQVWMNILVNAAQAVGEQGEVRVAARQSGAQVIVAITDSGPGIAPEHLGRIFDPFFTTKPVGEGTGLGLSICHSIVAKHGGTITAANAPGGGVTFTVTLPLIASAGPRSGPAEEFVPPAAPGLAGSATGALLA